MAVAASLDGLLSALGIALRVLGTFPRFLSPGAFLHLLGTADPLATAIVVTSGVAAFCWVLSIISGNYSQVDRLWSLLPVYYVFHFTLLQFLLAQPSLHPRLALMFALVLVWGSRLTYNFYRKGGYQWNHEDYRWPVLRRKMSPALYQVFNLCFIAVYQNILILLFVSPAYIAWSGQDTPLNALDFVAAALFVALLLGEALADHQQWTFQRLKHARLQQSRKLSPRSRYFKGFYTEGLFRYSRHPNFFCEISLWFAFYLFSVAASGVLFNWSLTGAVLLMLLFQGSTNFTEAISLGKYPEYAKYQQTTSRLIPWFPGSIKKQKKTTASKALKYQ